MAGHVLLKSAPLSPAAFPRALLGDVLCFLRAREVQSGPADNPGEPALSEPFTDPVYQRSHV